METRSSGPAPDSPPGKLMATLPRGGRVAWIGLRPARDTAMLRRDLVASAIPLVALKGRRFRGGDVVEAL